MAQQQKAGKPWSGANPIPNIQQFVEGLDRDKRERDRQIDEANKQRQADGVPVAHKNEKPSTVGKTVTDPTTGNQVIIEDFGKDLMKEVDDPMVRWDRGKVEKQLAR